MRLTPYFLEGVYLALGMAPNIFAVVDSPHCEMERAIKISLFSDRFGSFTGDGSYSRNRRLYTADWENCADSLSMEEKLVGVFKGINERHPHAPILLCHGALSLIAYQDIQGIAEAITKDIENPVVYVHQDSLDDDWIDGYRKVQAALFELAHGDAGGAWLGLGGLGLLRNEGDELGNADEIRKIFAALGQTHTPFILDGSPIPSGSLARGARHIALPFDESYDLPDSEHGISLNYPIGLEMTRRFVRKLGRFLDAPEKAEQYLERETESLRTSLLRSVTLNLAGRGAAIIADPYRAEGLWRLCRELGIDVPLVVILRKEEAGFSLIEEMEIAGARVMLDAQFPVVRETLIDMAAHDGLDIILGAGFFRDVARRIGLAYVEIGYPAYLEHFATHQPTMGIEGMLKLAERMENALILRDFSRA